MKFNKLFSALTLLSLGVLSACGDTYYPLDPGKEYLGSSTVFEVKEGSSQKKKVLCTAFAVNTGASEREKDLFKGVITLGKGSEWQSDVGCEIEDSVAKCRVSSKNLYTGLQSTNLSAAQSEVTQTLEPDVTRVVYEKDYEESTKDWCERYNGEFRTE